MNQCVTCHFYDRRGSRTSDGTNMQRGLCRRSAPQLNTHNARTHSVEGVWPTIRDDDWCGQWTQARRVAAAAHPGTGGFMPTMPGPAHPEPAAGSAAAIAAGYKAVSVKRA